MGRCRLCHAISLSMMILHCALALPVEDGSVPNNDAPFQLIVNPKLVNRFTTHNMTLLCEHNSNVQTRLDEIFRMRIVKKSETGWDMIAEQRDVVQNPSVNGNVRASANIKGDISTVFLQISWDTVGDASFGVFKCDVTGFDARANVVTESSPEFEIREFQNFIEHFENLSKETKMKVEELKNWTENEVYELKKDFHDIENSIATLQRNKTSCDCERRLSSVETLLGSLTQWPGGFYALLRPKTGCPVDLAFFGGSDSFHKIHSESQSSLDPGDLQSQAFSPLTSFRVGSDNFFYMQFCEITRQFNLTPWPLGSFCIHKLLHHPCPAPFTTGRVSIDTENTGFAGDARNNIADRVYDPTLTFCCQGNSSATGPIRLPTESPFLLYRYGDVCQDVRGMSVSEEFIRINTDDSGLVDDLYGVYPDLDRVGSSGIKFYLCYYTKL
ncbi:hypothetical protein EGW08_007521 [Elysia chlorotica]|uniref:Apextrin C-terminal domain-containing protein n=1 Tax=Elysia chlorotica TaxID=188477 RepID=A0A3S1BIR1_ELYCH|nr:hypothetical protein EGW08_007521 [Elysia chlorotica]